MWQFEGVCVSEVELFFPVLGGGTVRRDDVGEVVGGLGLVLATVQTLPVADENDDADENRRSDCHSRHRYDRLPLPSGDT